MITISKRRYKRQFVGITILFIFSLVFLMFESVEDSKQKYAQRKLRVERLLEDSSQVINALEYSITSLYPLQNERYVLPHTIKLNGNTCNFGGMSQKGQDYDFMFSGPSEMCNTQSALYAEAYKRMFVAPSMAYFAKSISQISSVYFISKDKFVISSPKAFAESLHGEVFDSVIVHRPYWVKTLQQTSSQAHEQIVYTGDYADYMTGRRVMTITRGVYVDNEFKGVLAIDNILFDLTNDRASGYRLTETQGENRSDVFSFTYSLPLVVAGKNIGLYLTVDEPKSLHFKHIVDANLEQLIALISLYALSLLTIWFRYTQTTNAHLQALAMRDPMTELLNRRGFETKLHHFEDGKYLAIAVFDIDDFKAINDTFGHQVGDDIICEVAKLLSSSLRQCDLIARFGGEEFVVAISGDCPELLQLVLERVQREMSSPSIRLSDKSQLPVTSSGGAVIYARSLLEVDVEYWFSQGLSQADQLLYRAKAEGKNRILIQTN